MNFRNSEKWALISTLGFVLPLCIIIGYAWGYWMDYAFGSYPWLTVIFTILGIIAAYLNIYRVMKMLDKEDKNAEPGNNSEPD